MNEWHALMHAIAAARGGRYGPTCDDLAEAAYALVDMRKGRYDVRRGRGDWPAARLATVLAAVLSKIRGQIEDAKHKIEAERVVGELRSLGFDIMPIGQ